MTVANAAEEMKIEGGKNKNPYWRRPKAGGYLNEKYPGGAEVHKEFSEKEGFKIIKTGQKFRVANFEKYLVNTYKNLRIRIQISN